MIYYTYSHNKPDGTPFYIGKGVKNRAYSKKRNKYWQNIVDKYGYEVQILAYWKTNKEALDHEILLISCFKDMGIKLTNMTNGGEGMNGHTASQETKEKISKSLKGRQGKIWSEKSRIKLSNSKKGIPLSEVTKQNMSKARKGKAHTKEHCLAISKSKIGKPHSEATKLSISYSKKGKPWTEARRNAQKQKKALNAL